MSAGYIGLPAQIDLGGRTYAVEREIRPSDAAPHGHSQAMVRAGVIGAAVLSADGHLFVIPVDRDGGMDPARLTRVRGA